MLCNPKIPTLNLPYETTASAAVRVGYKKSVGITFAVVLAVISLFISLMWAVPYGTGIWFLLRFRFAQACAWHAGDIQLRRQEPEYVGFLPLIRNPSQTGFLLTGRVSKGENGMKILKRRTSVKTSTVTLRSTRSVPTNDVACRHAADIYGYTACAIGE